MFKLKLIVSISLLSLAGLAFAADHPASSVDPQAALAKLKEGNGRFAKSQVSTSKPTAAKRAETAQAQHPFAVILACADSRTSPEIVFDEGIGDLFVVRTAGNLVDDHALGSIEYAVEHLGVRLIVVLGHERCGAVTAALASDTAPGHVESLVRDIQPAVKATKGKPGNPLDLTIAENARLMAAKIRSGASLGELAKQVRVISAVYDLDTGKVEWIKD
ncbi:MAG TPA: carbonic anhydrase [Chthoniobacterales bacterium]|jgi:carbonic anhydrase|nr:carbonic anhydrase [Chthoniobacterales bacterium]